MAPSSQQSAAARLCPEAAWTGLEADLAALQWFRIVSYPGRQLRFAGCRTPCMSPLQPSARPAQLSDAYPKARALSGGLALFFSCHASLLSSVAESCLCHCKGLSLGKYTCVNNLPEDER
jgi:hypothetical protein